MDPDPDWIRIQSGPWIRIRIQGQESEEEKKVYIEKESKKKNFSLKFKNFVTCKYYFTAFDIFNT